MPFESIAMYLTGELESAEVIGVSLLQIVHPVFRVRSATGAFPIPRGTATRLKSIHWYSQFTITPNYDELWQKSLS